MADTSAGTTSASAAAQGGVQSSAPRVSIRFISPSIDLADLPIIPNQPVSTSVGTLRAWATNALTNRDLPSTGLRLIYRGRVLDKDDKTLEQEFGLSSVRFWPFYTASACLALNLTAFSSMSRSKRLRSKRFTSLSERTASLRRLRIPPPTGSCILRSPMSLPIQMWPPQART